MKIKTSFAPGLKTPGANVYSPMASLAFKFSFYFGIISLIILLFYSIGEAIGTKTIFDIGKFLDVLGIVIVLAFASFATGGIIGFLFGIPHTIQSTLINTPNSTANPSNAASPVNNNSATSGVPAPVTTAQTATAIPTSQGKSNFTPSTNLEQIADWLTKIIVGVGLTQIHKILIYFNQVCQSLGITLQHYSMSNFNGSLIAGCIMIFFTIEGFLIVYLWTYLYLIRIQDSMVSDIINTINSKIADTDVSDKEAIDVASKQLSLSDKAPDIPANDLVRAFQNASKNVKSTIFFKAVFVRKQYWKSVDTKYKIEKTIPIFQALIIADPGFEFPENYAELSFALKDQRVPDYKQALLNLDKVISRFNDTDRITNKAIIFFNRAYCRIKMDVNFQNHTPSTAENKQLILNDLNEAAKELYVSAIISSDPLDTTINDWKRLNP